MVTISTLNARSIAWLVYGAFLVWRWFAAVMAFVHYKLHRDRPPAAIAQIERTLGIRMSVASYCKVIWMAAALVTIGALWIPRVWTPIIERMLHGTPTI